MPSAGLVTALVLVLACFVTATDDSVEPRNLQTGNFHQLYELPNDPIMLDLHTQESSGAHNYNTAVRIILMICVLMGVMINFTSRFEPALTPKDFLASSGKGLEGTERSISMESLSMESESASIEPEVKSVRLEEQGSAPSVTEEIEASLPELLEDAPQTDVDDSSDVSELEVEGEDEDEEEEEEEEEVEADVEPVVETEEEPVEEERPKNVPAALKAPVSPVSSSFTAASTPLSMSSLSPLSVSSMDMDPLSKLEPDSEMDDLACLAEQAAEGVLAGLCFDDDSDDVAPVRVTSALSFADVVGKTKELAPTPTEMFSAAEMAARYSELSADAPSFDMPAPKETEGGFALLNASGEPTQEFMDATKHLPFSPSAGAGLLLAAAAAAGVSTPKRRKRRNKRGARGKGGRGGANGTELEPVSLNSNVTQPLVGASGLSAEPLLYNTHKAQARKLHQEQAMYSRTSLSSPRGSYCPTTPYRSVATPL